MATGQIVVNVVEASNLKDQDFFGKMDPYVKLKLFGVSHKTRVASGAGKNPVFNQEFKFNVTSAVLTHPLILEVYDSDMLSDDFIGSISIPVSMLVATPVIDQWYTILDKSSKSAGKVHVISKFISNTPAATTPAASAPAPVSVQASFQAPPAYQTQQSMQFYGQPQAQPRAYPAAAYPPANYPPANYPPANYPPANYPPAAYPPTAYPTPTGYPPQQPGYPPQQPGYPPQQPGYPPQQPGYPPQQPGYPPQQPGYPPQQPGYPPQQPGYPPQQPGYPPQQPGYPPQQPGYPPQQPGYPPQQPGYPPRY